VNAMAISYSRLWKLLIDEAMNKTQLKEKAGVSSNAIADLGKNHLASHKTLEKIFSL
jgi:DNA (cytosine-5)-methyltransferase 1